MLAVLYILLVSALFVFVSTYVPETRMATPDGITGLFMLGCYLFGGAIGYSLPEVAAHSLGLAWGDGWLDHAAKFFGAVGGFLIATRGVIVWVVLFLLGFACTFLFEMFGHLIKH